MTDNQTGLEPSEKLKDDILHCLDMAKAEDLEVIDLYGKTSLADYMIIASGRSGRQVVGLAENLIESLHKLGITEVKKEGLQSGDWVILDAGDVIVHIFKPEVREFYNIEKMWRDYGVFATDTHSPSTQL